MTEHAPQADPRTPAADTPTEHVWLRSGVHAATADDGVTYLVHWPHHIALGPLTPPQHAMLRQLAAEPQENPCAGRGDAEDGIAALVERLRAAGWLHATVRSHDTVLYTLDPVRIDEEPPTRRAPDAPVLSRFAAITRDGDAMVLRVPRGHWDIRLHDPRTTSLVSTLTPAATRWRDRAAAAGVEPTAAAHLLRDLAEGGFLESPDAPEDEQRRQWNGHDLWFHANSRFGSRQRAGSDFGKTRWISSDSGTLPPTRESFGGRRIPLDQPDLGTLRERDVSLTTAVEDSRSIRQHDHDNPISGGELGEFLYRCARSRERYFPDGGPMPDRPYPSGGASYEIELYPFVRNVSGLAPGLYHYDPEAHVLEAVDAVGPALRVLAHTAQGVPDLEQPPQVLIILAARFGRVMREYQGLAYALTLKHVGVLYQLMYTVATAMGLAPCALGAGDAEAFSEAVGTDYLAESSVGEFILGSRKPEHGPEAT